MEKKLPSVFANKNAKTVGNNKKVFYSSKGDNLEINTNEDRSEKPKRDVRNVNQKINDIFKSSNYIYKADVELTLKSGKVTKRIVGRNTTHLITIENELIPLTDIIDIKRKDT